MTKIHYFFFCPSFGCSNQWDTSNLVTEILNSIGDKIFLATKRDLQKKIEELMNGIFLLVRGKVPYRRCLKRRKGERRWRRQGTPLKSGALKLFSHLLWCCFGAGVSCFLHGDGLGFSRAFGEAIILAPWRDGDYWHDVVFPMISSWHAPKEIRFFFFFFHTSTNYF